MTPLPQAHDADEDKDKVQRKRRTSVNRAQEGPWAVSRGYTGAALVPATTCREWPCTAPRCLQRPAHHLHITGEEDEAELKGSADSYAAA